VFSRLLMATVACALALFGCGTTEATKPGGLRGTWVEQAADWIARYDAAFDAGTGHHALFMAPDVLIDADTLAEQPHAVGRPRALRVQREVYSGPVARGQVFIGVTGVLRAESWTAATGSVDALVSMAIGDDGISRCEYAIPLRGVRDADRAGVVRLVGSHHAAWRHGAGAVADLYTPDARLTDTIRDIDVVGADAIAAVATTGALDAGDDLPRSVQAAQSTYVHGGGDNTALRVWAWQPGAGPCHADTVVALGLDPGGRITTERRFHALDALAACTDLREPDSGWWVGRDVPEPFGERVTGTVHGPTGPVQIRNGGPDWQRVVGWSLDQFTRAGLPAPDVAIVTFDPLDPRCTGRCGLASSSPPATILLCVDAAGQTSSGPLTGSVPLWPTHLVLHEIAHVWIDQHLDATTRDRFVERVGLTSWDDPFSTWDQRGNEWAAETIAWGLIDRVCTLTALGAPPCEQLAEAYETLTGVQPVTACPASDAGP
jgi:hypothetical protein